MVLVLFQFGVNRSGIVQNLDFLTYVRSVTFQWRVNTQAIVGTWSELELKAENEV